jgi:hypothetical protein
MLAKTAGDAEFVPRETCRSRPERLTGVIGALVASIGREITDVEYRVEIGVHTRYGRSRRP